MCLAVFLYGAEPGNAGTVDFGDLRRCIDQNNAAAASLIAPQGMADKRLLPVLNAGHLVEFAIGKENELDRKISGSMVIGPLNEVQQDPYCPDKRPVNFG